TLRIRRRRSRWRSRLRRLLFNWLLRRLRVVDDNLLWRRGRACRLQGLDLVAQPREFTLLGSSKSLHPLTECSTDALQSAHVIAQALKFVFRTECSSRLH